MALPSVIGGAVDAVQTADAFVQGAVSFSESWDPILEKLKALQSIGNYSSEVISLSAFFNTGNDSTHDVDPSIRKIGMVYFEYHSKGKFISFEIARRLRRHLGNPKASRTWLRCHVPGQDHERYLRYSTEGWPTSSRIKKQSHRANGAANNRMRLVYTWLYEDWRILYAAMISLFILYSHSLLRRETNGQERRIRSKGSSW